jgi:hypothetical protein
MGEAAANPARRETAKNFMLMFGGGVEDWRRMESVERKMCRKRSEEVNAVAVEILRCLSLRGKAVDTYTYNSTLSISSILGS